MTSRDSPPGSFGQRFQRGIIWIHRWLGIVACVLMTSWFVSGFVLAYVHFPAMDSSEKLTVLRPIRWEQVRVEPPDALAAVGLEKGASSLRLEMSGNRPVYRITDWAGNNAAVSATTGQRIDGVSAAQAVEIVSDQLSAPRATLKEAGLDSDQWTITGYWNHERPFHVVRLNDARGSQYYVSARTGEIVLDTRRSERAWNWAGAIPHWLYFEFLRHYSREGVWRWTIYLLSGAGIVVSLSGIYIGLKRLKLRARYANGRRTPFTGWMKWHHVVGLIGGLFLALWIISGFMTMYPGGLLLPREVSRTELEQFAGVVWRDFPSGALASLRAKDASVSRVIFRGIGGAPVVLIERAGAAPVLMDARNGQPLELSAARIRAAARQILPLSRLIDYELLKDGDEYWHTGFRQRKLPIVRVAFADERDSWFHIDPQTGQLVGVLDRSGRVNRWTVVAIHDVDLHWLLKNRPLWDVVLFAVTLPGLLIATTSLVIASRRLNRTLVPAAVVRLPSRTLAAGEASSSSPSLPRSEEAGVLVAFASQTGTAEIIARRTGDSLRRSGAATSVLQLGEVDPGHLAAANRAFFVVATTGDGDAPDRAASFQRFVMRQALNLDHLQYCLLALGDREYSRFCEFGAQVGEWLKRCGATELFPTVEVDDRDPAGLQRWGERLAGITGHDDDFGIGAERFDEWRLVKRKHVNAGSLGAAMYHLEFVPVDAEVSWQAGDIAQILAGRFVRGDLELSSRLARREYSIASVPETGRLHLLVRRMVSENDIPGVGSGFLTTALATGESLPIRICSNAGFHAPSDEGPAIFIGAGSGFAGLRGHLLRREVLGHRRNWLLFGERNASCDALYADDLQRWIGRGMLEQVDLVYSRDQPQRRYVQHVMCERADSIRHWIKDGAVVYVCGSLHLGSAVSAQLSSILGKDGVQGLIDSGRYRRDVY